MEHDEGLSKLWRDVFLHHWQEESQHAILDELEWLREDAKLDDDARDRAVTDLIELVAGVDGILQQQSRADADYFIAASDRRFDMAERRAIHDTVLKAYRWQYIVSGVKHGRFVTMLNSMITPAQAERVATALAPLL
jgi:hypothetical protein